MAPPKSRPAVGDIEGFFRNLRSAPLADLPRVQIWLGVELFLKERAARILEERIVTEEARDFALDRLEGSESSGEDVVRSARSMPFLCPHKLVLVREAGAMREGLDLLTDYATRPSPGATVILMMEERPKLKAWQAVAAPETSFEPLDRSPVLRAQIVNNVILAPLGKTIETDALDILAERTGNSLSEIRSQLEKIALYLGTERNVIRREDIEETVNDESEIKSWDIALGLLRRKPDEALAAMRKALDQGEEPVYLIAVLAGWFRLIIRIKALREQGLSPSQVAQKWASYSRQYQQAAPFAESYSWPLLVQAMDRLGNMDLTLKTTSTPPETLFESLALWLCTAKG